MNEYKNRVLSLEELAVSAGMLTFIEDNNGDDEKAFTMCASKTAAAATLLACEAVQVAAMCMKAQRGGAAWSKGKNG